MKQQTDWNVPATCLHFCRTGKLPFSGAPRDDRGLPDMHLALYDDVVVFDHATKLAYVIAWVHVDDHASVEQVVACLPAVWLRTERRRRRELAEARIPCFPCSVFPELCGCRRTPARFALQIA